MRRLIAITVAAAATAGAAPARASFPGANGKLVVQRPAGKQMDVWTVAADGSGEHRILGTRRFEEEAKWSPDGKRLAFALSPASGFPTNIWTVNASGGDARQVTDFSSISTAPAWAADGGRIGFFTLKDFAPPSEDKPPPPAELYSIGADGKQLRRLTHDRLIQTDIAYSPDGKWIAYDQWRPVKSLPGVYDMALMVSRPDGSKPRELTHITGSRDTFNASWSPDGESVVFEIAAPFKQGEKQRESDLGVIRRDGTHERRLTRTRALEYQPTWSPDGERIAFVGDLHRRKGPHERGGRDAELYTMAVDGSDIRRVTHNEVPDLAPDWQPLPAG
jgi:TolB protein